MAYCSGNHKGYNKGYCKRRCAFVSGLSKGYLALEKSYVVVNGFHVGLRRFLGVGGPQ